MAEAVKFFPLFVFLSSVYHTSISLKKLPNSSYVYYSLILVSGEV